MHLFSQPNGPENVEIRPTSGIQAATAARPEIRPQTQTKTKRNTNSVHNE